MLEKIKNQLPVQKYLELFITYRFYFIIVSISAIIGFTVFRINSFSNVARNDFLYDETVVTIETITFDEEAIRRITELQDLNVDVDAIFDPSRTNPFE